jgi:4-diphosphocytidyl-2-C-methyl-D-erythritol kinase
MVWAPAKVNLFLEVLGKRADGYHDIATLMVAVSLYDTLELKEAAPGQIQLDCNRPDLSSGPDNLVYRAAALLRERAQCRNGATIGLQKRIPIAAGLAGGSSDAAATLTGLNRLWQLGWSQAQLMPLAAELGSDVAFFMAGLASWCTGRGEKVAPVSLGRTLWLVLVCPDAHLSTAEVYSRVRAPGCPQTGQELRRALAEGSLNEVGRRLHNRLQSVSETLCPAVGDIRRTLEGYRPLGQLMSGSGPAVFALCSGRPEASRIAHELRHGSREESSPTVFLVRSCF